MDLLELTAGLLASTLRLGTPLTLAAMAGLLSYQVGLINIALEGFMLVGAFLAVVISVYTGNTWVGVLAAGLGGALAATLFALFVTDLRGNLIVTGLAVNFLTLGGTAYLLQILFSTSGTIAPAGLEKLPLLNLAGLSELPFFGKVLFNHSPLVYLSWLMVPVTSIFLYRMTPGLHIRAVGENMEAAGTAGISVRKIQYLALVLGGILCGLAGAHLSVGDLALFRENMTSGRGFIGWRPFTSRRTDLDLILRDNHIQTLILTGTKTNVCIRATAQDAFSHNYAVIVPRECVATDRQHLHEANLEDIDRYLGNVVSAEEALNLLSQQRTPTSQGAR